MESTVNYLQVSPFVHQNYQCPALNPIKIRYVSTICLKNSYMLLQFISIRFHENLFMVLQSYKNHNAWEYFLTWYILSLRTASPASQYTPRECSKRECTAPG